jgi:hypothetical protein
MRERATALTGASCSDDVQLPYRLLALRVIHQALRDAVESRSAGVRSSARQFLRGSPSLSLWCALAEIDPQSVAGSLREKLVPATRPVRRTP